MQQQTNKQKMISTQLVDHRHGFGLNLIRKIPSARRPLSNLPTVLT